MKKTRASTRVGRGCPILPAAGLVWHLIVLGLLFLLMQSFPIALTASLWRFALAFSAAELLLSLLGLLFLRVELDRREEIIERKTASPVTVVFRNCGPIPFSLIDAAVSLPTGDKEGTRLWRRQFSLPPFAAVSLEAEPIFWRRGHHLVGCREIYVYDVLHLFRVKRRLRAERQVQVVPRRLLSVALFDTEGGHHDMTTSFLELSSVPDYGDIRDYRPGDSMKQIHWKLSTKGEELQVRRYSSESQKRIAIVCDPSAEAALFSSETAHCEAVDAVLEEALAAVTAATARGFEGFFTLGGEGGFRLPFGTDGQEAAIRAALAAFQGDGGLPTEEAVGEEGLSFFVLPFVSVAGASELLARIQTLPFGSVTVLLLELGSLLTPSLWQGYEKECEAMESALREWGVTVLHTAVGEVTT